MTKTSATISDIIVNCSDAKLGYTPPMIFKQRARLIKLVAEASMALNEHMKVTDDRDFVNTLRNDNKKEWVAAIIEVVNERKELEYNLACHINNLFYYDQEEWSQSGHDCESIMSNTAKHKRLTNFRSTWSPIPAPSSVRRLTSTDKSMRRRRRVRYEARQLSYGVEIAMRDNLQNSMSPLRMLAFRKK